MPQPRIQSDWEESQKLFQRYLEGDGPATRILFETLQFHLEGFLRHRLGGKSEVHDLVQITLMKVHFARDRYDSSRSLKTWIFTIAQRSLIDHWRATETDPLEDLKPVESATDSDISAELSNLEAVADQHLTPDEKVRLSNDLNQAMNSLKPLERSIVYLYGVQGLSMSEIAEIHGLTETAVKLRAHRAYAELRKLLGLVIVAVLRDIL